MKRKAKQILSAVLCLIMVLSLTGSSAFAAEHVHDENCGYREGRPCMHSEHNDACGYVEAVTASPCTHEHDEACGYAEATDGQPCTHEHGDCGYEPAHEEIPCDCGGTDGLHATDCSWRPAFAGSPCQHTHDGSCGYVAAKEAVPCSHEHDKNCGYQKAVEGSPCKHALGTHDDTCGYVEAAPCNYVEVSYTYILSYCHNGSQLSENTGAVTDTTWEYTVSGCTFTNPGFDFIGWGLQADAAEPAYRPGDKIILTSWMADDSGTVSLTLYALWREAPEQTWEINPSARYYDSADCSGSGTVYPDAVLPPITVGNGSVTANAADYPPTITVNDKTYCRKGLISLSEGGTAAPADSLSIPAYPQTEGSQRDSWRRTWSDGFIVAYVPEEAPVPPARSYSYTISYHRNDGSTDALVDGPYTTEDTTRTFTAKAPDSAWGSRRFLGWALNPDDTKPAYQAGDKITLVSFLADSTGAVSLDLYALWEAEKPPAATYTVTVKGTYIDDPSVSNGAGQYKAKEVVFLWPGDRGWDYKFSHWSIRRTEDNAWITDLSGPSAAYYMPEFDITATANWTYVGEPELKLVPTNPVEIIEVKDNDSSITFVPTHPIPKGMKPILVHSALSVQEINARAKELSNASFKAFFMIPKIVSISDTLITITALVYSDEYEAPGDYRIGDTISLQGMNFLIIGYNGDDLLQLCDKANGTEYHYRPRTKQLQIADFKVPLSQPTSQEAISVTINGASYLVSYSRAVDLDNIYCYLYTPEGKAAGFYICDSTGFIKSATFNKGFDPETLAEDPASLSSQFIGTLDVTDENLDSDCYSVCVPFSKDISLSGGVKPSGQLTVELPVSRYPEDTIFLGVHYAASGEMQFDNTAQKIFKIPSISNDSAAANSINLTNSQLKKLAVAHTGTDNVKSLAMGWSIGLNFTFSPFIIYALIPQE